MRLPAIAILLFLAYLEGCFLFIIYYTLGLKKIDQLQMDVQFLAQLEGFAHFRAYGIENRHEFLPLPYGNYVETLDNFQKAFPELDGIIGEMLNFYVQRSLARVKNSS